MDSKSFENKERIASRQRMLNTIIMSAFIEIASSGRADKYPEVLMKMMRSPDFDVEEGLLSARLTIVDIPKYDLLLAVPVAIGDKMKGTGRILVACMQMFFDDSDTELNDVNTFFLKVNDQQMLPDISWIWKGVWSDQLGVLQRMGEEAACEFLGEGALLAEVSPSRLLAIFEMLMEFMREGYLTQSPFDFMERFEKTRECFVQRMKEIDLVEGLQQIGKQKKGAASACA